METSQPPERRPISLVARVRNVYVLYSSRLLRGRRAARPWPDFDALSLERTTAVITYILPDGSEAAAGCREVALFTDAPGNAAVREGWFRTLDDYVLYAELTFIDRYPDHPFAADLVSRSSTLRLSRLPKLLTDRAAFERWAQEAHTVRERM